MSTNAARAPLSTTAKVFIAFGIIAVAFLALPLLVLVALNISSPIFGDTFGMREISVENGCPVDIRVTSEGASGVRASAAFDDTVAAGATAGVWADPDAMLVSAPGGRWKAVRVDGGDRLSLTGTECPQEPTPADAALVAARAALLADSHVTAIEITSSSAWPFARENSDVTTITAHVDPALATEWVRPHSSTPSAEPSSCASGTPICTRRLSA